MNKKEILKISKEYAKKAGFVLNKDKKQLSYILKGLKKNEEKYGFRFCPCRVVTGDFDKDRLIICPCIYHKQEIKDARHCLCRLFFSKSAAQIKAKQQKKYCDSSIKRREKA